MMFLTLGTPTVLRVLIYLSSANLWVIFMEFVGDEYITVAFEEVPFKSSKRVVYSLQSGLYTHSTPA